MAKCTRPKWGFHALAVALLLAAAPAARAENTLSGQQIRDLMTGTTVAFKARRGNARVRLTFAAGGKVSAAITGGRIQGDRGTWEVVKDRVLCLQFERLNQGRRGCISLTRQGRTIHRYGARTGKPAPIPVWTIVVAGPGVGRVGVAAGPPVGQRGRGRGQGRGDKNAPDFAKDYVTGPKLRALVSGTTVSHISPRSGHAIRMTWNRDGSVVASGAKNTRNGTWSIERGQRAFCLDMPMYRRGKTCMFLIRRGTHIERYTRRHRRMKGADWVIVELGPDANRSAD